MDLPSIEPATLQVWLGEALGAMHKLVTGRREVTMSVGINAAARSVTYNQASLPDLRAWINGLTAELSRRGAGPQSRRRAIGVRF